MNDELDMEFTHDAVPLGVPNLGADGAIIAILRAQLERVTKERDAANQRAETNHATIEKILAASKSKDLIIAGLNQKVEITNKRAEQAESDARNNHNRWIEASRQQEIAEADARALAQVVVRIVSIMDDAESWEEGGASINLHLSEFNRIYNEHGAKYLERAK